MLKSPWTKEQVDALNDYQHNGWIHPFTCGGDRCDEDHVAYADAHGEDCGLLIATEAGWYCPACNYKQDWCHEFMTRKRDHGWGVV